MITGFLRWLWICASWEASGALRRQEAEREARLRLATPEYDHRVEATCKRVQRRWARELRRRDVLARRRQNREAEAARRRMRVA